MKLFVSFIADIFVVYVYGLKMHFSFFLLSDFTFLSKQTTFRHLPGKVITITHSVNKRKY